MKLGQFRIAGRQVLQSLLNRIDPIGSKPPSQPRLPYRVRPPDGGAWQASSHLLASSCAPVRVARSARPSQTRSSSGAARPDLIEISPEFVERLSLERKLHLHANKLDRLVWRGFTPGI